MSVLDPAPEPSEFVTTSEAARLLGLSDQGFYSRVKSGKLLLPHVGRQRMPDGKRGSKLYRREDVLEYAEEERKAKEVAQQTGAQETVTRRMAMVASGDTDKTKATVLPSTIPLVNDKSEELVNSEEAAMILGIKRATFYIQKSAGKIPFRCVGFQKISGAKKPVQLFLKKEVQEYAVKRSFIQEETIVRTTKSPETFTGETAAIVFDMLDRGMSQVDIVKETKITPREIEEIKNQWSRMKEGILLDGNQKRAVEEFFRSILPIPNFRRIESGKDLVNCLHQLETRYVPADEARRKALCRTCVNLYEINPREAVICATCARKKYDVKEEKPQPFSSWVKEPEK